jgi:hypothetical protein
MAAQRLGRVLLDFTKRILGKHFVTLVWLAISVRVSGMSASQVEYTFVLPDIFA